MFRIVVSGTSKKVIGITLKTLHWESLKGIRSSWPCSMGTVVGKQWCTPTCAIFIKSFLDPPVVKVEEL